DQVQLDAAGTAEAPLDRLERLDPIAPLRRARGLAAGFHLRVDLGVARLEESHERRRGEPVRRGAHFAEALALVKDLQELAALRVGSAELDPLAEHDRPG